MGVVANLSVDDLIDQEATAEVVSSIGVIFAGKEIQVIESGMMATMDYRADRVRVWLNADRTIKSINEG